MSHIVLLGDSIFDNKEYTHGEPDVVSHLLTVLPDSWQATLLAIDGSTTADVAKQFDLVPSEATHLVLSLGGNDAILNSDLMMTPISSSREMLNLMADRVEQFEQAYRAVVNTLIGFGHELTICTIYNGNLDEGQARIARIALMTFNDVILRVAFEKHLKVIDLRLVCDAVEDYANPIEPSGIGGKKIADAIARSVEAIPSGKFSQVSAR